LQHIRRDAARRAGLSATADPCIIIAIIIAIITSSAKEDM